MKTKFLIIVSILSFVSYELFSQTFTEFPCDCNNTTDHLVPEKGIFSMSNSKLNYYKTLKDLFNSVLPSSSMARVLVIPANGPEYIISIDKKEDNFVLTAITMENQISKVLADKHERSKLNGFVKNEMELSPQLTKKLFLLFSKAIAGVKFSDYLSNDKDTIKYIFMTYQNFEYRCGVASGLLPEGRIKLLTSVVEWLYLSSKNGKLSDDEDNKYYKRIIDNLLKINWNTYKQLN